VTIRGLSPVREAKRPRVSLWNLASVRRLGRVDTASAALAWYTVITVVMTWPVSATLGSRLPLDLGDPLLNCWILWWGLDHLTRFLSGEWTAFAGFWNANIFHPEPLTLAYSEHLLAQALQALPVYAVTRNVVLSYNLLFLSTFVLSGLGMYLLARDLTGRPRAAFVAGLLYAFAPYRTSQLGHLQVLSSQWMPLALFALRRYFAGLGARREQGPGIGHLRSGPQPEAQGLAEAGSRKPEASLLGATLAFALQALSCGYFLLFFAPFVALYVAWEVWARRLWTNGRMWAGLAVAAGLGGAILVPFLLPYLALREHGFPARTLDEVQLYSADAFSYLAGTDRLRLWAPYLGDFAKLEGFLFPGLLPVALALAGLAAVSWTAAREERPLPATPAWRVAVAVLGTAAMVGFLRLAFWELFAGPRIWRIREACMPLAYVSRVFALAALSFIVVVVASPAVRRVAARVMRTPAAFFLAAVVLATWLSFGPHVQTKSMGLSGETIYAWLYRYVPGFDGLRVPARFAMLGAMFLAALSAWSLAALDSWKRWGRAALAVVALTFLAEAWAAPLEVEALQWERRDTGGAGRFVREADLARLYEFVRLRSVPGEELRRDRSVSAAEQDEELRRDRSVSEPSRLPRRSSGQVEEPSRLPRRSSGQVEEPSRLPRRSSGPLTERRRAVLELPFGELRDETRAVFFSSRHGHALVNGYSGGFPRATCGARRCSSIRPRGPKRRGEP